MTSSRSGLFMIGPEPPRDTRIQVLAARGNDAITTHFPFCVKLANISRKLIHVPRRMMFAQATESHVTVITTIVCLINPKAPLAKQPPRPATANGTSTRLMQCEATKSKRKQRHSVVTPNGSWQDRKENIWNVDGKIKSSYPRSTRDIAKTFW